MQTVKKSKLQRIWQCFFLLSLVFTLSFGGEINAQASFGRKPAKYSDLNGGHKMFLAEISQQRSYIAYPQMKNLSPELLTAFSAMKSAAIKSGIKLAIVSGYRNYNSQVALFFQPSNVHKPIDKFYSDNLTESEKAKVKQQYLGRSETVAPPGYSEHSTGLAIDINTVNPNFASTRAYRWLKQHAKEFGFTLSYPENSTRGTFFEPWHWRFDGNDRYRNSTPISTLAGQLDN
jgi:LAS superfamily LD-carboxypeptidase LdcB